MTFYIAPRFLEKLSVHITKNYLNLPDVKVPLILGVHGRKGEGKSFQCDLAFQRMGLEVVYMSAGELESPDAGDPARLVRVRYREAAELVRVRGRMAVLMINDIDAGAGRVDQYTQYTVNTQLVNGTLMNIADNPTNVQLPGSYEAEPIQRIPIIVTGNDFSTLYAPLIRDGRMEKFFWEPSRDDRIGIVTGIFHSDRVQRSDIEILVDTFPDQATDFYGALRSRLYDEQVHHLITEVGLDNISRRIVNSKEAPPEFRKPDMSLPHLIEVGNQLVQEQRRVQEMRLAEEYNKSLYFNRKLGETLERERSPHIGNGSSNPESFFRSYSPESSPSNGHASNLTEPMSYPGQSSGSRLQPEQVSEVNRILNHPLRLGIEVVSPRRFRTNSWACYGTFDRNGHNGSSAIAALETCLQEHPHDYVRLVGISGDRSRVIETIIQRPPTHN